MAVQDPAVSPPLSWFPEALGFQQPNRPLSAQLLPAHREARRLPKKWEAPVSGDRNPELEFHRLCSLQLGITFPHLQDGPDVPALLDPV